MTMKGGHIHLICNAHLDPVWKWEWEEGLTEALSTFETAVELLEEDPDLIFNHNESILYQWVLEYRPDLFRRIQDLVASGRWQIAGGWYLQPDCNLPEGECFIRQILVGRQFFRKHFGIEPEVAYNFDAFGHHGNLPQMLQKTGYRAYVHFRPDSNDLQLPGDLYTWKGIDGSPITAYRPPMVWYGTDDREELRQRVEASARGEFGAGRPVGVFWGMGDHGGGATRGDLEEIRCLQKQVGSLRHSTTEALLRDFEAAGMAAEAPVWEGDLQRVFTGCYTSVSATKRSNRRSEALVQMAERQATLAWWFLDHPYPGQKLAGIWEDVLFNQFHDILPGSSTRKAMEGTYEIAGRAMKEAREMILESQLALMARKQRREPLTVVVFNPHPRPVHWPVDLEYMVGHRPILTRSVRSRVTDAGGGNVPCQEEMPGAVTTRFDWRKRVVFEAALPAMGSAEFQIHLDTHEPERPPGPVSGGETGLQWENEWVRFILDGRTGLVQALSRKPDGRSLLKRPGGELAVFEDGGDAWGTDRRSYDRLAGVFRLATPSEAAELTGQTGLEAVDPVRIIEEGDVRTVIESLFVFGRSTASIRYFLYRNRPDLEAEVRVIWNQPNYQLKWIWPTRLCGETYRAEIPYGDIRRRQGGGEQTHLRWLALEDPGGEAFGLCGIGPSGHDVREGEARVTLLRSAIYCHATTHPLRERIFHDFMDLGESRFRFGLLPGMAASIGGAMVHLTERLTLPPAALVHYPLGISESEGIPSGQALISLEGEGLELGAMKRSEDGHDLIVRIVERGGRKTTGSLSISGIASPYRLWLSPYEIRTLRISRSGAFYECDLLERPL